MATGAGLKHLRELCEYIGFGENEVGCLRKALPKLEDAFPSVVEDFYQAILNNPGARRHLSSDQQIARLKRTLRAWLVDLFTNLRDEAYLERRLRVGQVHVQIGLAQIYVYAAMGLIRNRLNRVIVSCIEDADERDPLLSALHKALDIDLAILSDSYLEADKFRDLVENAPEMIHTIDVEGRFVDVNRTEQEALGYSAAEFSGMRLADIVPAECRDEIARHVARSFNQGFATLETQFKTRDGRILDVEIHSSGRIDRTTGTVASSRAYVRDVTERKRLLKILQQKERLAAVGEMAVTLAHEVKNPLTGISGAIQILARQTSPQDSRIEVYNEIQGQIRRLDRLVEDLLQFGRPIAPRFEPVALGILIQRTYSILREGPDLKQVRLELGGSEKDFLVQGDPFLLQQVFVNLMLNAAHAVGGVGAIRVALHGAGQEVVAEVSDTGPGIPSAVAEKIFQPFFTTKPQGSGLGLPICQRIVEAHGGKIETKTDGSVHALFRIRLPAQPLRPENQRKGQR